MRESSGTDMIRIRPAASSDASVGAYLEHLAMGKLADFLFGLNGHATARSVLIRLFAERSNRFSHQFADVAEVGGQVAGILISYPARLMKRLVIPMARQLLRIYGLFGMIRLAPRMLPLAGVKEAREDEYFIHILAVLPGFQGKGIGTRLLAHAEEKARRLGLSKCALSVEIGNTRARNLYERLGYRVAETIKLEYLKRRISCEGFYRMVNCLRTEPGI